MLEEEITSPVLQEDDNQDSNLRPKKLDEFIGQDLLKENLKIFIEAAKKRGESLDHSLFYGPPGLGKTTLANIVANELNVKIISTSAPAIEKPGDLAAILTNLNEFDCLFIDEIHRMHPAIEEILYPAMEDYNIDVIIGQGPAARSIKLNLKPFTLVGATTRAGMLTPPLRARFGIINRIDFYPDEDMAEIIKRSSKILNIEVEKGSIMNIAKRSRGTPRIANRLLRRLRDFAQIKGDGIINEKITEMTFNKLNVDKFGLDHMDRKLLETIITKYSGGPVGLDTLSVSLGEDPGTIEDIYEPFLIQIGFIERTSRGRVATKHAFDHLNLSYTGESQQTLF